MSEESRVRAATIFDVARLAGVSHQTVSRVVNDLPNVRVATRDRVNDAIKQLRYRPSTAARALVTRRSRTLGLITTGAADYGPANIMLGFNEAARNARYTVSISSMLESEPASIRNSVELLLSQNVEAIVLIAAHRGALEAVQGLELGVPLLAVESSGRSGFHSVSLDHFAGAFAATQHLIELGHREIVHLAGPIDSMDASQRVAGWRTALAEQGIVARTPMVGDWSPQSGYEAGLRIAADRSITAVFSGNDQMAIGILHALRQNGLSVPDDLSLVGFDDIPEAQFFSPPLTTVRGDFAELGRTIMATLSEILIGSAESDQPHTLPMLIERASTARLGR